MFVDSLDAIHVNSSKIGVCSLGSSELEVSFAFPLKSDFSVSVDHGLYLSLLVK